MDEPPPQPPAPPPSDAADVDSLDGIVNALYSSVSFDDGRGPDWDRFRGLFDPNAVMVRVQPGVSERTDPDHREVSSIEDYVARTNAAVESGALTAFTERELTRRTEVFADLAQVFSTYERSADAGEVRRGINSLQLVRHGERWWVVSLAWTDETDGGLLPSRYLPRP
ncbi:hypothetical protein DB30_06400 [Enhygromyxa salina]|uniref:SnoaL-like domain-containing protein n=1 Tax=Enhygromyxa salina TaxID=215803 RepID=A0A0C1ZAX9_9BACT|nr:hypothetical protein [Enhygromyxa salina]KIG14814.1 hypothetical protein DB30_06400 [Enhygromyxa salina]